MRKVILMLLLAVLLAGCESLWSIKTPKELAAMQKQEQEELIAKVIGLASIKTIYMGDFGKTHKLYLVRKDVIKALKEESTRFDVVENPNIADAVMTVINSDSPYPAIRLLDVKKDKIVWNFECQSQTILWSEFQKLGCNSSEIVDKLLDDAQEADDYIAKNPTNVSVPDRPPATKEGQ